MKIAFVDLRLNLKVGGGSNQALHLTASHLANLGHDVMVITMDPSLDAYPDNLPYRVTAEGLNPGRFGRNARLALQKVLHKYENQVDIYEIRHPDFLLGGAVYRRLGGRAPVVVHLNNYGFCKGIDFLSTNCPMNCGLMQQVQHRPQSSMRKALLLPFFALERCLEILIANQADAFTPVSPAVAEIYISHGIDKRKIFVVPAPIDYEYLRSAKENHTRSFQTTEPYNVLYVGRLSQEKGVDILIHAIRRLEFPLNLHLVGDGRQKNSLRELCDELGLRDRVIFHGWVPYNRVVDFYLTSQLFVHPARWPEPLGLTVLDAMAMGLPVIAADSGGPPWALQNAGLTFRPEDADDLAEKIRLVHGNPSLAASLAEKAQERAKDFDYKKAVSKLLEVYRRVIEGARTRKS